MPLEAGLIAKLHADADAARWRVSAETFALALEASALRGLGERSTTPRDVERYLRSLHLGDLALACACAAGDDEAWDHFVREYRPVLYRAADALDPSGGARELADALYADLFGVRETDGERRSLFRYFHGRSTLATWLRAVLSQRLVDRARAARRTDALPDDESAAAVRAPDPGPDPDRLRLATMVRTALTAAIGALAARDRLRLGCYYAHDLTLAQVGRLLGEHEATVSRNLTRVRQDLRRAIERHLRETHGLDAAAIAECFAAAVDDPGSLDVVTLIGVDPVRKTAAVERSRS
jgi:RNA polymerase sigma-70 factor (ECF subfamily)